MDDDWSWTNHQQFDSKVKGLTQYDNTEVFLFTRWWTSVPVFVQPFRVLPDMAPRHASAGGLLVNSCGARFKWNCRWAIFKLNLTHLPLEKMAAILADDIFKCIFLNQNYRILIQISLKFVPRSPIDNKPALVQVMAWRRTGDKSLPEPMLAQFTDAYMRH